MRRRTTRTARGRWVSAIGVLLLVAACSPAATQSSGPSVGGVEAIRKAPIPEPKPTPTPFVSRFVRGWPDTTENAAGLYSWDGSDCSTTYCVMGFMHNGYGSGDVEIRIEVLPEPITDRGAVPATVAGYEAIYRRIDARRQTWIADIEGRTIAIRLETRPGTRTAELAEAHAIIESMRTEPRDNALGFRLVFMLTTDDWDSG